MIGAGAATSAEKHEVPAKRKSPADHARSVAAGFDFLAGPDSRPLLFAYAVCIGAAAYFSWGFEPSRVASLAAFGTSFLLCAVIRAQPWRGPFHGIAAIALGIATGHLAGSVRTLAATSPTISAETRPVMVEGWVTEVEPGARGVRLRIEVHAIAGLPAGDTPQRVRLTHRSRLEVAPGRFVRCWAVLRPPPAPGLVGDYDFQRQAWFEQLGGVGYVQGRCRGGALGAPSGVVDQALLSIGATRRNLALAVADGAGERAGGFAAALVSGDRSLMSFEDQEALRQSGLAHILAISGLNLAIVGGLVFFCVKRILVMIEPLALRVPVQKPAAILALAACLAYFALSGAPVSAQRAIIMTIIVFAAVLVDRAAISLRTFSIALFIVVLLQPESVMAPDFQMSFAATGALIATYEAWREWRSRRESVLGPIGFSWASILMTSLVGGLATAPYSIYHFDRLAPYGFAANLAAMPIISFVTAPAAAIAFVCSLVGLENVGLRLLGYSLEPVLAIAHYFANLDTSAGASPHAMPPSVLALISAGLGLAIAARGAARVILLALFCGPALWIWDKAPVLAFHWSSSGTFYAADESSAFSAIPLTQADGLGPLRFSETVERACEKPLCTLHLTGGLSATLISGLPSGGAPEATAAASATLSLAGETRTLYWGDIAAAGPHSGYLRDGKLIITAAPACGTRPWKQCPARVSVVTADK